MLKIIKYITLFFTLATIVFTLSTCKKYPENTLWFKNKHKLFIIEPYAKLTGFTVNGIDSLQELNSYFGWRTGGTYNINTNNINEHRDRYDSRRTTISFYYSDFFAYYSKNRKQVSFYDKNPKDTSKIFKKNIFIDDTPWQIINLIPNKISKIKKTINNNTYELQFESNY